MSDHPKKTKQKKTQDSGSQSSLNPCLTTFDNFPTLSKWLPICVSVRSKPCDLYSALQRKISIQYKPDCFGIQAIGRNLEFFKLCPLTGVQTF